MVPLLADRFFRLRGVVAFFFFSYARTDAKDPYLHSFYEDLCRELATRGGMPLDEIGFLDVEQPAGLNWSTTSGTALATAKVFVSVYSPTYFKSEYCGKEWHTFRERLRRQGKEAGTMVPVWWVPPKKVLMPVDAVTLHDSRDGYGPDFAKYGLRYLLQLDRNRAKYQEFLVTFAETLLEAAEDAPEPEDTPVDLVTQPNAFAGQPATPTPEHGADQVTYILATGTREEMRLTGASVDNYGDDYRKWRPYHPVCSDPIGPRAQVVAGLRSIASHLEPADTQIVDRLRRARGMVVVIVDPWAFTVNDRLALIRELNGVRLGNTAVLLPGELGGEERIKDLVQLHLDNWRRDEPSYRDDIPTMDEFASVLDRMLIEIRARLIARSNVVRRIGGVPSVRRPLLEGPT